MNGTAALSAQRSPPGIQRRLQSLLKGPNQPSFTQEKVPVAGAPRSMQHQPRDYSPSASGKLFQDIIGKPIPEPPPKLPSQISVSNVARVSLEDTMTEGSDAAADYSSDGSEDRCVALALTFLWYATRISPFSQHRAVEAAVQSCHE